ncbi:MAG: 50S ribosomal protein L9, partial [Candidatus Omnitrophica bacterium CG1_02_49_10]
LVSTGPDEKLYGSVTNADIARALKDEGLDIDKKSIDIKDPITRLGIYQVDIKLHPEITTQIRIWIVKE